MQILAIGLWGCFFGMVLCIFAGSVFAYTKSLKRIARNAALFALLSALYVISFLGIWPIRDAQTLAVCLALVSLLVSIVLFYLLFAVLGLTKSRRIRRRTLASLACLLLLTLVLGWRMSPNDFLLLCTAVASVLGLISTGAAIKKALSGDRLAWAVLFSACCVLLAQISLSAIAQAREQASWSLYAGSALVSTLYIVTVAGVLWSRYAYLIELNNLLAYGPSYDPVTRMRSHAETGQMVGAAFKSFRAEPQPLGIVVLTISNLYALDQLHGAQAVNHALFVCATRLRRTVPSHIQTGRLGHDGFVLLMSKCKESIALIDLARAVAARLRTPVAVTTSRDATRIETDSTVWVADIGIGILMVSDPESRGSDAIAMGRRMSRTAISYASRIAWFDHLSGETVELPDNRLL